MMKFCFLILITIFCKASFSQEYPEVHFKYASIFDTWCSRQNKIPIKDTQRRRLISVFSQFQKEWNNLGPKLLKQTTISLKKNFLNKEMLAGVFLCKKTPSMGFPLLINGNWFSKEKNSLHPKLIVAITYHELLHTFIEQNYSRLWPTKLTTKYLKAGEPMRVLTHLHLTAIQKFIYLELGLKKELEELVKLESSYSNSGYRRAWEIINKIEGHEPFINELLQ